jgi:hypothetical protein
MKHAFSLILLTFVGNIPVRLGSPQSARICGAYDEGDSPTRKSEKWPPVRTLVTVVTASTVLWAAIIVSVAGLIAAS